MPYNALFRSLTATMLLALAACSGGATQQNGESEASADTASTTEQAPPTDTEAAADTAALYREKGKRLVKASAAALKTQLGKAIAEGGVPHAIDFCNVHAMPITDSLSKAYGLKIARVSDRPRNPQNAANAREEALMQDMRRSMEADQKPKPQVLRTEEQVLYYHPITIANGLCLNCHGTPGTEINEETLAALDERYPRDQARGYALGDLRGLWKLRLVGP
jgi:hypothetical protein